MSNPTIGCKVCDVEVSAYRDDEGNHYCGEHNPAENAMQTATITPLTNVRDVRVGRLADNAIVVSWVDATSEDGERFSRWFDDSDAEQRIRDALGFACELYAAIGREERGQ